MQRALRQLLLQLAAPELVEQGHDDRAAAEAGEGGDDEAAAVPREHTEPLPRAEAEAGELIPQRRRLGVQLPEGERAPIVDQRGAVGPRRRRRLQQAVYVHDPRSSISALNTETAADRAPPCTSTAANQPAA